MRQRSSLQQLQGKDQNGKEFAVLVKRMYKWHGSGWKTNLYGVVICYFVLKKGKYTKCISQKQKYSESLLRLQVGAGPLPRGRQRGALPSKTNNKLPIN